MFSLRFSISVIVPMVIHTPSSSSFHDTYGGAKNYLNGETQHYTFGVWPPEHRTSRPGVGCLISTGA